MSNNVTEAIIGAIVVATAVGFFMFVSKSTGASTGSNDVIELSANFNSVEGVRVGTDVRLAGVKVGTVNSITLDKDNYKAVTKFSVDNDLKIPEDSEAIVASEGLLGGNFIELTPGASDFMLEDGDLMENTQSSISLLNLLLTFVTKSGDN